MKILKSESLKPAVANDAMHDRFMSECRMFQHAWDNYGSVATPCPEQCALERYTA
jgi:hypothetical protein